MTHELSRRAFLGTTAGAAIRAGFAAHVAQAKDAPKRGANERLNVGLIGSGNRGTYLSYVFQLQKNTKLAAVCDVHEKRMAAAAAQCEGVSGEKPAMYNDYRQVLADKDIDAVIVATPSHWHVLPAIHACQAGKDVYFEKPVATSIGEGRAAIKAAERYGRIIQMGTQQHSWAHYKQAVEIIQSGGLGEISNVHVWDIGSHYPGFGNPPDEPAPAQLDWDFWLGPAPKHAYNSVREQHHYWFFDYGGAWQVAWGAHHYDVVHWALQTKAPTAAVALGARCAFAQDNREWPDTFVGACEYGPGPVAKQGFVLNYTARSGCDIPIEGRWHGKAFYGTKGALIIDRQGFEIRSSIRQDKKVAPEQIVLSDKKEHEVVQDHAGLFLECVRSRRRPPADIEVGHYATCPGHLMNIAWRQGRRIEWDATSERITNDADANRWLTKPYRAPWSLPG